MKIEKRTQETLVRAYLSLQQIITDLYAEADNAVEADNHNDASLLESQANILYPIAENLGTVIAEQEE